MELEAESEIMIVIGKWYYGIRYLHFLDFISRLLKATKTFGFFKGDDNSNYQLYSSKTHERENIGPYLWSEMKFFPYTTAVLPPYMMFFCIPWLPQTLYEF